MSIQGRVVTGTDIRQLKRAGPSKRVLTMAQDEMQKAKSCSEMLQFEKPDPLADKAWPVHASLLPDLTIVDEFEKSL